MIIPKIINKKNYQYFPKVIDNSIAHGQGLKTAQMKLKIVYLEDRPVQDLTVLYMWVKN